MATEGAQEVAPVAGGPVVDLEVVVGAGGVVLQLKVAEGEQDGGALGHHDQPRALCLVGVRPREVGAGEVAGGCREHPAAFDAWVAEERGGRQM